MRRTIRTCLTALCLSSIALAPACDKDEAKKADGKKADGKKADAKKADAKKADEKKADEKKADAPAPEGDALVIAASHVEPKPTDPVKVRLTSLKVVEAKFDPANLEGGSAKIEIDPTALDSGSEKRDNHLKSDDYLDLAQFATITVAVSDIKKVADSYSAKLVVDAHGTQVTWDAVPFKVTKTEGDAVTVELTHAFKRTDFGIGTPPGPDQSVADELEATLTMTLKKTG